MAHLLIEYGCGDREKVVDYVLLVIVVIGEAIEIDIH